MLPKVFGSEDVSMKILKNDFNLTSYISDSVECFLSLPHRSDHWRLRVECEITCGFSQQSKHTRTWRWKNWRRMKTSLVKKMRLPLRCTGEWRLCGALSLIHFFFQSEACAQRVVGHIHPVGTLMWDISPCRQKRLAEWKASQMKNVFGEIGEISGQDYIKEVNKAGDGIWVVLHLYKQG